MLIRCGRCGRIIRKEDAKFDYFTGYVCHDCYLRGDE